MYPMPRNRNKKTSRFVARVKTLEEESKKSKTKKAKTWSLRPEVLAGPNIPSPMHGVAPRVVLGKVWWDNERKESYKKTSYHCIACGVNKYKAKARKWLEGHELYDVDYRKGTMTYVETIPLCHYCHNYIHDGRLTWLLRSGKVSHGKYAGILQHGDKVLAEAGLRRPTRRQREEAIAELIIKGEVAEWDDWRLIVHGKKYPPIKTYEEWKSQNV